MKIFCNANSVFQHSRSIKPFLRNFIIGAWLAAPMVSQAGLSFVGNGNVELSTSQASPNYTSVGNVTPNTGSGFSLGNLSTIAYGQSLYLGGQIQTNPQQNGSATLFYRIGTSGSYFSLNLAYSRSGVGPFGNNNLWDSNGGNNGGNNANTTYYSANIASLLTYGTSSSPYVNTVDFYFSAFDSDNGITMTEGSAANPYSFTVTAVPEPITLALPIFGGIFGGVGLRRYLSKRANSAV